MRDLLKTILLFAIYVHVNLIQVSAQSALDAMYTRITSYDGLSSNSVNQTIKDRNGYIYFATSNGLDRYDGKNFKSYKHEPNNKNSLSHNKVLCLLLDDKNRLWVGTSNGLNIKQDSDTFISFQNDPENPNSISNNRIETITQDYKGRIWIGTQDGLNLYHEQSQSFRLVPLDKKDKEKPTKEAILSLYQDKNKKLWIGSWNKGLTIIDLEHNDLDKIINSAKRLNHNTQHSLSNNSFAKVFEDGIGRIWGQQFNGHLYLIDYPRNKSVIDCHLADLTFIKVPVFEGELSSHNSHIYSSLYQDNKGLYLNTSSGFISLEENRLNELQINSIRNNFDKLTDFNVVLPNGNDIFEDDTGIVWIATNNGVFKYYGNLNLKFEKNLETYCKENEITIISFHEDGSNLWLGTDNGLYVYNQKLNDLTKINYTSQGYETLKGIWDIEVEGNRMWLGTIAGLLYYIEDISQSPYTVKKLPTPGLEDQESNNHIWQIEYIDEEQLFLATHKGVYVYNPTNDSSKFYETSHLPYVNGDNIFDIIKDSNNRIWASVTGHGLFELILRGDSLYFEYKTPVNDKLVEEVIFDLEIENDNIWIANISGIQKYNITENKYYSNELLNNTISNQVLGIAADDDKIFFVTADGLYSYNENENKLKFNNNLDGVVSNSAILGLHKSESGKIYLGGTNGYNILSDQENSGNNEKREVIFTDLKLSNESVVVNHKNLKTNENILTQDIQNTSTIELSYKHKFITLNFGVLDYLNPHQYSYSYFVEGLDEEWKNLGNKQSVALTNLNPGSYKILVKGTDKYNKQIAPASLNITVLAPLWQQPWFALTCLLFFCGLVNLLIKYNQKKIIEQKNELEKVVNERTEELITNNEQLKLYIESNLKLEQFAHAASHDLKSPMRTISSYIGLLRIKMKGKLTDKETEYFDFIEDGTQRLHNLVNDMLEFAKIKSDNLNIEDVSGPELVDTILESLSYNIEEKKAIVTAKNIPDVLTVDKIKFSRVLQNLVTNALKFVEPNKIPIITIYGTDSDSQHCIKVKDNGIGISSSNQEKIFDIFSRVAHDDSYDGTGMGLAISRKIVESHNGKLTVASKFGQGSEFIINLPSTTNVHSLSGPTIKS